ncbi:MAG: GGDEF domain-containing protein [Nocardioides sp.]
MKVPLDALGKPSPDPEPPSAAEILLATVRALLRAGSRSEAAEVLQAAVADLGGEVVPAHKALRSDLPVDVSLGAGEPLMVRLAADPAAADFLSAHLAALVEDASWAALQCDQHRREMMRASVDTLTRVASRVEIGPRLGLSEAGDAVCLLDLDNFKRHNDTYGHYAGDATLRAFGALLRSHTRDADFVGRYGGDEFLVVFSAASLDVACERMRLLADRWLSPDEPDRSVSIGVAVVDRRGGVVAASAADKALYRAKREGRNRVERAVPDDYGDGLL